MVARPMVMQRRYRQTAYELIIDQGTTEVERESKGANSWLHRMKDMTGYHYQVTEKEEKKKE